MGEGKGAAVQSRHNDAKVSTGTMAPDGGGEYPNSVPPHLYPLPCLRRSGFAQAGTEGRGGILWGYFLSNIWIDSIFDSFLCGDSFLQAVLETAHLCHSVRL